jgi:hypothetical protein
MDMKTKSKLFFSRRNTNVTNRYELDEEVQWNINSNGRTNFILKTEQVLQRSSSTRGNSNRDYTANRTSPSREAAHKEETLTEIILQTGPLLQETAPQRNSNRDYTERNLLQENSSTKETLTEIILKIELLHKAAPQEETLTEIILKIELLWEAAPQGKL